MEGQEDKQATQNKTRATLIISLFSPRARFTPPRLNYRTSPAQTLALRAACYPPPHAAQATLLPLGSLRSPLYLLADNSLARGQEERTRQATPLFAAWPRVPCSHFLSIPRWRDGGGNILWHQAWVPSGAISCEWWEVQEGRQPFSNAMCLSW